MLNLPFTKLLPFNFYPELDQMFSIKNVNLNFCLKPGINSPKNILGGHGNLLWAHTSEAGGLHREASTFHPQGSLVVARSKSKNIRSCGWCEATL